MGSVVEFSAGLSETADVGGNRNTKLVDADLFLAEACCGQQTGDVELA